MERRLLAANWPLKLPYAHASSCVPDQEAAAGFGYMDVVDIKDRSF
jgi:hypothetical protein